MIAQAGYHIDLARHVRDTQPADQILQTRAEFKREIGLAQQLLAGNPGAKIIPEWFVKMQEVAFSESWDHDAFFRLFDEAIAREPDYYTFYFEAAHYLREREKAGAWERFAELERQKFGAGGAGDVLYTRIAWSVSVNCHNLFSCSSISWETMAAGFNRLIAVYPDSRWLKNAYAWFAFKAGDRVRLRPALAAVVDNPDMGIWVNLENVGFAKKFAEEPAPTAPSP